MAFNGNGRDFMFGLIKNFTFACTAPGSRPIRAPVPCQLVVTGVCATANTASHYKNMRELYEYEPTSSFGTMQDAS